MSPSFGCSIGPAISVSFRDHPLVVVALPSKTTLSLVVVLLSFTTPCMGRKYVNGVGSNISSEVQILIRSMLAAGIVQETFAGEAG